MNRDVVLNEAANRCKIKTHHGVWFTVFYPLFQCDKNERKRWKLIICKG